MINCCNNLNRSQSTSERLTEDTVTTVTVGTSATVVLTANVARRLVKIYLNSSSNPSAETWIRYGAGATSTNAAHILPFRHLVVVDSGQAANAISAVCTSGTAQLRVSVANAL